jgi:Fe2+ transport system protein FeoA
MTNDKSWKFTYIGGRLAATMADATPALDFGFPLVKASVGDRIWIVSFRDRETASQLGAMGLKPGTQLQMMSKRPSGSVAIATPFGYLGLGATIAQNISVRDRASTAPHP